MAGKRDGNWCRGFSSAGVMLRLALRAASLETAWGLGDSLYAFPWRCAATISLQADRGSRQCGGDALYTVRYRTVAPSSKPAHGWCAAIGSVDRHGGCYVELENQAGEPVDSRLAYRVIQPAFHADFAGAGARAGRA